MGAAVHVELRSWNLFQCKWIQRPAEYDQWFSQVQSALIYTLSHPLQQQGLQTIYGSYNMEQRPVLKFIFLIILQKNILGL